MIQKQKGFSAPVLALSVWTAALAEEMQTGISPRGMIIHGAVQALLLTCISGVFSACWQRAAMQWVWLFSAGAWFLAELFGTVMQAQNICQQEFRSMALIGLLPLLLWAGWCIPPSGWDAPAQELLRAWSADVFSRMDALLLLIWLTCAIFRIGFLCAAVRTVWQRAVQCGKGAAK